MDPRPPVPFAPRPDTGGKNADYIRAQIESGRGRPIHEDDIDDGNDDSSDAGRLVAAIILVPILTGVGALIITGLAKVLS